MTSVTRNTSTGTAFSGCCRQEPQFAAVTGTPKAGTAFAAATDRNRICNCHQNPNGRNRNSRLSHTHTKHEDRNRISRLSHKPHRMESHVTPLTKKDIITRKGRMTTSTHHKPVTHRPHTQALHMQHNPLSYQIQHH